MAVNLATLRSNVELALAGRVAAPFSYRDRHAVEIVSTGIAEIDSLAGGLPRGALTEIFGPACSGRTTLLLSALAARTAHAEACALIDGCDAFDPHSAEAAGVELKQLLWVRCRNIEQTLRATDLLLQGGGFGFIALDLGDMRVDVLRHVPLESWFRFRRAVEDTQTILMVLEPESNAKTCASLVLRMEAEPARWSTTLETHAQDFFRYPPSWLLEGFGIRAELLRSGRQPIAANSFHKSFASAGCSELFETNILRSYLSIARMEPAPK
jgi:recombination protein RecA